MIDLTERGTKLAIHGNRVTNALFTHIQRAADQGTRFPAVKLTQEQTALADVKRDSPETLTIARKPHNLDGLQGIADEPRMEPDRAREWAVAAMSDGFGYLEKNPALVQHIDVWEIGNEASPHNLDGWYNFGAIMRECVNLGRARYPSIAWGIGSFNAGEPEYDEMKAFLESGVLDGAPDDVVICAHEGVLQPGDPIDAGQGDLIPGAETVPEHGGSLMGRVAYFAELAGEDMVPVVVSEAYLQGYGDAHKAANRMTRMDAFYSQLWYVIAYCPFTHSPTAQWQDQDYTPAHALLFDYMAAVADRQNATKPVQDGPGEDEPQEPDVIRHTIHLLPQDTSGDELAQVTEHLHPTRSAFTYSHDVVEAVMYHSTPDGKVVAWDPERWDMDLQQRFSWLGVGYEERVIAALSDPLHGLQLDAPFRKPFALTSRFNAERDYANGLHEGADYDILGEPADSQEPVLAMRDGRVVISRWTDNAYGHYVVTEHEYNGVTFRLWFAHMDARFVHEGETVEAGQPVGELGGTGGPWNEHIHLNLQVPGRGLSGYAIDDVIDPDPYVSREPVATTIDMAQFFLPPEGQQHGDIIILKNNWGEGDERQQLQRDGNVSYVTKGNQWEKRTIHSDRISLDMDTSPGDGRFYAVDSVTGWMPRYWAVGNTFRRQETVRFYEKVTCEQVSQTTWASDLRFAALHDTYETEGGVSFGKVAEIHWLRNGQIEERYFYTNSLGLIQWENRSGRKSWAVERIPRNQQEPNQREIIPCL